LTANNRKITVSVAFNYGGRWDILQACRKAIADGVAPQDLDETRLSRYMSMSYAPDPDLFIRTGGELRISNFLLWQSAYTEFVISPIASGRTSTPGRWTWPLRTMLAIVASLQVKRGSVGPVESGTAVGR
jgi:hypothetical protein